MLQSTLEYIVKKSEKYNGNFFKWDGRVMTTGGSKQNCFLNHLDNLMLVLQTMQWL